MLSGDGWRWVRAVGSKGGWKGTEKTACRELPDWGTLAALCWHSGVPDGTGAGAWGDRPGWLRDIRLVPGVIYFPEHERAKSA